MILSGSRASVGDNTHTHTCVGFPSKILNGIGNRQAAEVTSDALQRSFVDGLSQASFDRHKSTGANNNENDDEAD